MRRFNIINSIAILIFLIGSFDFASAQELAKPKAVEDKTKAANVDQPVLELTSVKWMLTQIEGVAVPEGPRQPYIHFNKKEGSAGGRGGCNSYGGKYKTEGEKLTFSDVMSTMMACNPGTQTEITFFYNLQQTNRHKIEEGELRLYKDENLLLVFQPEKKKPAFN